MRKSIFVLCVAVLILTLMAGCGDNSTQSSGTTEAPVSATPEAAETDAASAAATSSDIHTNPFNFETRTVVLNSGYEMPIIGIGTFQLSNEQAEQSVYWALEAGARLIDTAAAYNNETGVGRGIQRAIDDGIVTRGEIFVTTKLWPSNYNTRGIDQALSNLGLDYIDLLLLHQPSGDYIGGYQAMEQAVEEGKLRSIGLSNFSDEQFSEVADQATILPAVHQVETHLHNQQTAMRGFLDQYGTVLEAWFPLGGRGNTQIFLNDPTVLSIAEAHGKSAAQIILRWHLQDGHIAIPGSSNQSHIQENVELFDFELTDEEMADLRELNENAAFFPGMGSTSEETQAMYEQWAEEWGLNIGEIPEETDDAAESEPASDGVAQTTAGLVRGTKSNGIYQFFGIPYAEATERFVPAGAVTPWDGVFEALEYGNISPQVSFFGGGSDGMDNNCQNLNIWTPGISDGEKRPVMVWFHGGGMTSGSANEEQTNGENLAASEDVVVVTVNHRLGILGYLDLESYGAEYAESGNVGVLDMVSSLQWIRDNIEAFGGDPDNVTIFGQSGGGAKVLALMTSPNATGLFHKAINESGATDTLGPVFNTKEVSERITELVLQSLEITTENISDLQTVSFEELNTAGTEALAQAAEEYRIPAPLGGGYSFEWMPVVDGGIIPTHPVLDEGFAEAGFDIPLLIGTNLNEWQFNFNANTNLSDTEVLAQLQESYGDNAEAVLDAFQSAYPGVSSANVLFLDTMLRCPILKITAHKADQDGAPVYSYVMTYGAPSAVHGAEIPLVFNNDSSDMAKNMSAVWAQFARSGNPTIDGMPEWVPYTRDGGAAMILDTTSRLAYNHDKVLLKLLVPDYTF